MIFLDLHINLINKWINEKFKKKKMGHELS